jgi:hypothetical protein
MILTIILEYEGICKRAMQQANKIQALLFPFLIKKNIYLPKIVDRMMFYQMRSNNS